MSFEEYYQKTLLKVIQDEDEIIFPKCPNCGRFALALCSFHPDKRPPELRVCKCGHEFWHINSRYDLLKRNTEINA